MSGCTRALVALTTVMIVASNASVALAAPPKPGPKAAPATAATPKAYEEGVALFRAGNSEAALAIFNKLTNIESRRGAAFALEKLGRTEEAIAEFQKFIAGAPPGLEDQVKAARARVAELSAPKATGKVRVVTSPAGATIEVVGHPALNKTSPAELDLPPGKHVVRATLAGNEPSEREIEVAAGSNVQEVSLELAPKHSGGPGLIPFSAADMKVAPQQMNPTPRIETTPPSATESYGAPIITGVAGVASLTAGVIFGFSALSKASDYDEKPTIENLGNAETSAALSTTFLTAGVLLGAVTVVLLVTSHPSESGPAKTAANAMRTDGLRIRF